jgi:catechol 2,3-dioxygenase-like lactoylglutathione lyase family enzyme
MVSKFESEKKLGRGNRACPRVRSFSRNESGDLHLELQHAMYFDQVGTNLTLDHPFDQSICESGHETRNVREWDLLNGGGPMLLPPLNSSRLANTIGVAIGVTAKDQFGQRQILKRLRGGNVAVYENQWHVPFSFALAWPEGLEPGETLTLSELIARDYGYELAEELPGIEPTDFYPPRPLAFCRDMVRGGKPQFFYEIQSRLSVDELRSRVRSDGAEYKNQTGVVDGIRPELSPELLAFSVLVGMQF